MSLLSLAVPSLAPAKAPPGGGPSSPDSPSICDAIPGNLVANCGFETGDFTDWTEAGNTSFTGVSSSYANSGNFGAYLGAVSDSGFSDANLLSQNLATIPGGVYTLRYFLMNDGGIPAGFQVFWNGAVIPGSVLVDSGPFGYTEFVFKGLKATGTSTQLLFESYQNPAYWGLDDISVVGGAAALINYYDVASSARPSAAGYGGSGQSGGAGDSLLRIVNPTHSDTVQLGTLCAMIYVFDDNEEMQTCCGCPVTPDGLRTMSVINQLTGNFGLNGGNMTAGAIKMVSAEPNWTAPPPYNPPPPGIGAINGSTLMGCDPSGTTLGSCVGRPIGGTATSGLIPVPGLRAWLNHTETMIGSAAPFAGITSTSVEEFAKGDVDSTELCNLESSCGNLVTSGSGAGTCSCGAGDSASSFRPRAVPK